MNGFRTSFSFSVWSRLSSRPRHSWTRHNGQENTLGAVRQSLARTLRVKGVSEPLTSADLILAQAIGRKTLCDVSTQHRLSPDVLGRVDGIVSRCSEHFPLQYALGEWDFCDLTFDMRPPVFIPRPETEELVMLALCDVTIQRARTFIEVGCGSGVISTTILKRLPSIRAVAIDRSEAACELTLHNAQKNGVSDRLTVHCAEWNDWIHTSSSKSVKYDFLISNPPYIPDDDMLGLQQEILRFEDRGALCGGVDGLSVVKDILNDAPNILNTNGSVWLEVDTSHPSLIERLLSEDNTTTTLSRLQYFKTYNDFTNRPRFCHIGLV